MKILMLTSSTGGGHDLRANSFKAWAEKEKDLGIEVEVYKPLENSGWHYQIGVDLYKLIQTTWPGSHHVYWNILEYGALFKNSWALVGVQHYIDKLEDFQPDVVISVHPQINHGFFDLTRKVRGEKTKCMIYCGELDDGYGFSRHWVNPEADFFMGATDACCSAARRLGMARDRTYQAGFMLKPASFEPHHSQEEKDLFLREMDLEPGVFTLLLATGALGANNHLGFLNALDEMNRPLQVVSLCGKVPKVLETVRAWRGRWNQVKSKAIPYSDKMPLLMQSVSAIVTRGGTGTTSEAMMASCPVITNLLGGSMPQEVITIKYCKRMGFLRRLDGFLDLPPIVEDWLEDPDSYRLARERLEAARPPGSPRQILEMVKERA